jgi:hypothetical protein
MNCADYQDWVQRRLDGDTEPSEVGDEHRRSCPQCARLDTAMARLERGLRLTPVPLPSDRLAEMITYQVLSEQRTTARRRVLVYVAAMAACLLLGIYLGSRRGNENVSPEPRVPVEIATNPLTDEKPKVNDRVGEAGEALATLFSRTADEAVGQGKLLLPSTPMTPMTPDVTALPPALEPPAQSIKEAGQGVTAGLEPVTSSARRAFNMFMRDMPPVTQ